MGLLTGESWVESAQDEGLGRPLSALPFCVFQEQRETRGARIGVGIGDRVLDLALCARLDLLHSLPEGLIAACNATVLNPLIASGVDELAALRMRLQVLLGDELRREATEEALLPLTALRLLRPVDVPNYTDFYASREHAERVGRLFRPDTPLLPNYQYVPIGYHGRASSIVVSGTEVRRPWGQIRTSTDDTPVFAPTRQLDYEMEIGAYVRGGNSLGSAVAIDESEEQIFGLTLLNDWSARDVQAWEYQPLGPFLGKSFATTVGAWVLPWEALEPYRLPVRERETTKTQPLAYLRERDEAASVVDLAIEAWLQTARMREQDVAPVRLGRSNMAGLNWTLPQMIAHHTSNGCNLLAGDLLGTGTISGAGDGEEGCLLERGRAKPARLPTGELRSFLEDGDEVLLRGFADREGLPRTSLGECRGVVLPAHRALS